MDEQKKVIKNGSLQEVTQALVDLYLSSEKFDEERIMGSELYERFLQFIRKEGYQITPTLQNVGRALSARLVHSRSAKGTLYYLISENSKSNK